PWQQSVPLLVLGRCPLEVLISAVDGAALERIDQNGAWHAHAEMTQAGPDTDSSRDVLNFQTSGSCRIDGLTDETTRIYRGYGCGGGMAARGQGTSAARAASRCLALRRRALGFSDVR